MGGNLHLGGGGGLETGLEKAFQSFIAYFLNLLALLNSAYLCTIWV